MAESPAAPKSILTGIGRELLRRCPGCGESRLSAGFLRIRPRCPACRADNTIYPSDDFPPYLTILVVGHIVVPLFGLSDRMLAPPVWVQMMVWAPVTVMLCLLLLPAMKGASVGLRWATDPRRG